MYKIKLSPYQKTFYNEWKINPSGSEYNIVFDQSLSSNIDILELQNALIRFISDYAILNSHITRLNDGLYWMKNAQISQLKYFSENIQDSKQIKNYVSIPFDLENSELYRFAIFHEPAGSYRFILVFHHILVDGSSFDFIITEISKYYNNSTYKAEISVEDQLKHIAATTEKLNKQLELHAIDSKLFWSKRLADTEPLDLKFITRISNICDPTNTFKELRFNFTEEITFRLGILKDKYNISAYWYSQIIFATLLSKYTFQSKFAISYPILIKEQCGLIYGAHVNTNFFPYDIAKNTTPVDLIAQTLKLINDMKIGKFNHGYYPVNEIMANTNKEHLNVFFTQTNLKDAKFNFNGIKTIKINHEFNIDLSTKLLFEQEIKTQIINFRVRYNSAEIDEVILKKFLQHYKKLYLYVLNDLIQEKKDKFILQYPILDTAEYQQIMYERNKTYKLYPRDKTVDQLFEEQVKKTPTNIAIVCKNEKLTYQELNNQANQLANYLRDNYKIQGDDLVAFCLNRSKHILITMLAILKSGAGYVPIDPIYPDKRISYILEDTRAKVVFTNKEHANRLHQIVENFLDANKSKIEPIDNVNYQSVLAKYPPENLFQNTTNKNLAYVIYTSGTTGIPKGVMIEHMSVVNYLYNIKEKIFNNPGNVDFSTNISFDLTVTTTIGALCAGCKIYIYSGDVKDVDNYKNHLINNKINIIKVVPSYFELLINSLSETEITTIVLGGEKTSRSSISKVYKENLTIYDEYGPTEATVGSCLSNIYANGQISDYLTIGVPYNNYKIYVLDASLNPLPDGAIGELYIGGDGLARGYLNNPELTKAKFIANPYQSLDDKAQNTNNRLYKTGDLVRYLPNGNLEYLGRNDLQIKIKGFRIEPREIEEHINHYPGIKQSVVVTNTQLDNIDQVHFNEYLAAYYVSDYKLDETSLFNYLATKLPHYMLPEVLIHIIELPLTINGKLDKSALPGPNLTEHSDYVPPRNDLELKICNIYSELLKLSQEEVGINHDFFKLGGNSISAIHLVYRLQHEFKISLNDIFKFRTPARIAESVPIARENLRYKLKQMKLVYHKLSSYEEKDNVTMESKKLEYLQQIKQIKLTPQFKNIRSVLLTGVTGHLGSHILYQLLFETQYKIYLLVRASSDKDAYERVNDKFKFYFDGDLDNYKNRVTVLTADLRKPNLDLNPEQYNELVSNVDSIIHAAALVKHYGEYSAFYQTNVQATINLLELSKLTALKDFHYISTLSVLTNGYVPNYHYYIFTENDNEIILENNTNIYSQTKYEGELNVIKYRNFGINSNIYRVGNLSMNSTNYRNQVNIEENAFFTRVKTVINLGMIPKEMSEVEISPVDKTALAIIKLFNQGELSNQTYHVANPHRSNLFKLLKKCEDVNIRFTKFNRFIDNILTRLDNNSGISKQIELFMLHQVWLEEINLDTLTRIVILQDRTNFILNELGFCWPYITSEMLSDVINKSLVTKELYNKYIL